MNGRVCENSNTLIVHGTDGVVITCIPYTDKSAHKQPKTTIICYVMLCFLSCMFEEKSEHAL